MYLDVHAAASKTTQQDAILLTAAHELTHHIRLNAEAQYDALKEFVIEHLLEQGQDFETMVQDKLKEKGMKRSDAVEEVIADACEMVLKDSKAVEKLAKENKSLAQTIADWLHGFYEDIKAAFEGVEARSKEAKAMTDYMDELVKLWDDALIEASKGESKQSGRTKASYAGRNLYKDSSVYDYDYMVSQPDMVVHSMPPLSDVKIGNRISQEKAIELGLENAAKIGKMVAEKTFAITNVYSGKEILLGPHGLNHSLGGEDINRLRTNARLSAIGGYTPHYGQLCR